jgi:hypothetical protein
MSYSSETPVNAQTPVNITAPLTTSHSTSTPSLPVIITPRIGGAAPVDIFTQNPFATLITITKTATTLGTATQILNTATGPKFLSIHNDVGGGIVDIGSSSTVTFGNGYRLAVGDTLTIHYPLSGSVGIWAIDNGTTTANISVFFMT